MIYQFGEFSLDTARRELSRAGLRIDVGPMAFDLLQHLIGHVDRLDLIRPIAVFTSELAGEHERAAACAQPETSRTINFEEGT